MQNKDFFDNILNNNYIIIDNIDDIEEIVVKIVMGEYINILFKKSYLKDYFLDIIHEYYPECIVINSDINYNINLNNSMKKNNIIIYNIKKNVTNNIINIINQNKGIIIC